MISPIKGNLASVNRRKHGKRCMSYGKLVLLFCSALLLNSAYALELPVLDEQVGTASYYGKRFHGRLTANGERFNMHAMTAAHRYYPLGSRIRVTNLDNQRSIEVRINDRGPYIKGRILDLSRGAAQRLGFVHQGLTRVRIELLERGDNRYKRQ